MEPPTLTSPASAGASSSPIASGLAYPSRPKNAEPQQRTAPVSRSAHVCCPPNAIWLIEPPTLTLPATAGVSSSPMLLVLAYPSSPEPPEPQQRTSPVLKSAQLWLRPRESVSTDSLQLPRLPTPIAQVS